MTTPTRLFSRILSLAIQGKLVDNSADEDADALLSRIKAQNTSKKKTSFDPIKHEECPFEIPDNWKWVRLGEIAYIASGSTPSKDCFVEEGIPYLKMYNLRNNEIDFNYQPQYIKSETHNGKLKRSIARPGDIIMNIVGPPLGKVAIIPESLPECNFNQAAVMITSYLNKEITNKYIRYYLLEMGEINSINTKGTAGQENISLTQTNNMRFPLPPLAVQSRIVAKLDEIKALVDECDDIEADLDKNAELLRKKVLDKAIRGRLTTQLPSDGDAQTLIDQISAEKAKSSAKNKKQTPPQPITPEDQPFQIPVNWKWVRLGEIGETNTGSTPSKSHPEYYGNFIPFLSPGEIQNNTIVSYNKNGLSKDGYEVARPTPNGTVLQVCIGGSIGKCAIIERECCFNQQINSITPFFVLSRYVYYTISSEYFVSMLVAKSTGSATPIINKSAWESLLLPLPPLAEQSRIVAKIEEVFAQIDKLRV